jgi:hypothetical protein
MIGWSVSMNFIRQIHPCNETERERTTKETIILPWPQSRPSISPSPRSHLTQCAFPPRRLPDGFWPENTALKPSARVSMTSAIMYWINWTIQRAGAQSLPSGSLTWLAPRIKRVDRVDVVEGCCEDDIFCGVVVL